MTFRFDDDTAFDQHRDTDPGPKKRRGGRTSRAGDAGTTPDPPPEPVPVKIDRPAPDETPAPTPIAELARPMSGLPRTGNYPVRRWRKPGDAPKSKAWARSNEWIKHFFKAYRSTGIQSVAADHAGVSVGTVKNRRNKDPKFAARMQECEERIGDQLLQQLYRLTLEGNPVLVQDRRTHQWIDMGHKPDPILLMFAIKRWYPEFRENYKADDQAGQQIVQQLFIKILEQGKAMGAASPQAELPSFDDFIDVTPAETAEQKVERLRAELAAAEAEATTTDARISISPPGP